MSTHSLQKQQSSEALTKHASPKPTPKASPKPSDIPNFMISYSHQDKDLMIQIRDLLEASGFDVWVDTKLRGGSNFFSNIGSAIIGCDVFIFILTANSVSSKFCQDEVSLARISNKKIFPITYCHVTEVMADMDAGLRLILSCVQWIILDSEAEVETNNQEVMSSITESLDFNVSDYDRLQSYEIFFSEEDRQKSVTLSRRRGLQRRESAHIGGFWSRHFGDSVDCAQLKNVLKAIKKDYKFDYLNLALDDSWALKALTLWCFDLERNAMSISREQYDSFTFPDGKPDDSIELPDMFWLRCKDGFSIRLSMHEVFDAKSSVRFDSIKNLSKIKSKRVLLALHKLFKDQDPNVRAIACVSLSYACDQSPYNLQKIHRLLKDEDRLVRESACLALARLKNEESVQPLLDTWRNDMISDVRAAALKALESIGTEDAFEGMKMVKTLQEELNKLSLELDE